MKRMIKGAVAALALVACAAGSSVPAMAGDDHGNFMVRALVTGVLPDTDATVKAGRAVIPGANAEVNDEVIPATTLTYFFNDNFSLELFCCFAKPSIDGKGTIAGLGQIATAGSFRQRLPPSTTSTAPANGALM